MIAPDQLMGFVWIAWVVSWLAAALWSDRAATRPAVGREIGYRVATIVGVVLLFGFGNPAFT